MMNRFVVWSAHVDEVTGESRDVVEVSRSVRSVAEDDLTIIRDIFKRRGWIQDLQSQK